MEGGEEVGRGHANGCVSFCACFSVSFELSQAQTHN